MGGTFYSFHGEILGTLSIDSDDDASQPRQTGPRVSFSAGKTKFEQCRQLLRQTTTFSLRRTLSCSSLLMALKDLHNLHLISHDDGLIDDGEFIVLYDLYYSILEASSSSRSFCFCFEVKSE